MVDGMGALPFDGGVAFRVWAPNADAVAVTGDFDDWSGKTALTRERTGNWYAEVAPAKPGHEYKFVITNGEHSFHRVDPYAREVTNSIGNGVIHDHRSYDWEGDDFELPGHHELVIYEVHIGSFFRRDGGVGTLALATEKLDHLVQLGVNVIQVMPVAEFAGDISWGYNPAHIFAVESAYGGPNALKDFVKAAHRRGIGVVLDVVYNHFGPSDLDLWQFDGWQENGKGGIYFYNDDRSSTPWGDTRPDYGREEVRRYIHDNAMMWLSDYHVDGLRLDMTQYIRTAAGGDLPEGWDLMRWINMSMREHFPRRIAIAEDMAQDPRLTRVDDHGAAFHTQWDSAFVHPIREAVIVSDDAWRSMVAVVDAVTRTYNGDAFQRVVYTESHDEVSNGRARVPHEVNRGDETGWHAVKRSTVGAALALTAPGIPMLFQGQEFLEGGWFRDDVPLDWGNNDEFSGVVRLYRDLIALRRNTEGRTRGLTGQGMELCHVDDDANLLAFHRWSEGGPGDDTVVIVNFNAVTLENYPIALPHAGRWELKLNSDAKVYCENFGDTAASDLTAQALPRGGRAEIRIAPYTVLVYSFAG